jgi:hypothetical protein
MLKAMCTHRRRYFYLKNSFSKQFYYTNWISKWFFFLFFFFSSLVCLLISLYSLFFFSALDVVSKSLFMIIEINLLYGNKRDGLFFVSFNFTINVEKLLNKCYCDFHCINPNMEHMNENCLLERKKTKISLILKLDVIIEFDVDLNVQI